MNINAGKLPNGLVVRSYEHGDEAQVVQLWNEVFPDNPPRNDPAADIRRKLTIQRELFLVGELAGRIVGTVMAGFDGNRGWLHRVAVADHCRRQGIGQALVHEAEKRLAEIGCPKVNLQVHSENQPAIEFYKALGFQTEERISMGKRLEKAVASDSG